MWKLFMRLVSGLALLVLGGCASMMPTYRLADNVYGALGGSSIEIIYLDSQDAPLTLAPSPEAMKSAFGLQAIVPGPTPMPIVGADPVALKRIQDEAQVPLMPYQDEIGTLNVREKLFANLSSTLTTIPAMTGAKMTRMAQPIQTGPNVETHGIALNSKSQIVIIISATSAAIRYDGATVSTGLQLDVYAKPHPTQAVLQDHHLIFGHAMPPGPVTEGYNLHDNLQKLFADSGSLLSADLDATLGNLCDKLRYYFHAIDTSPQIPAASGG
ncbi:MAG: hypothetical protein ACM3ZT_09425 [Bacillota bacterium]